MITAHEIAKALGGEARGNVAHVRGPSHASPFDRSLTVTIKPDAPDGFIVHSFAGDDFKACRDYVKKALGLALGGDFGKIEMTPERAAEYEKARAADLAIIKAKRKDAARIWHEASPITDSLAARYILQRLHLTALPAPMIEAGQMRFHPAPYFDAGRYGLDPQAGESRLRDCAGAMVCRLSDPITGEGRGIHRTLLTADGLKYASGAAKRMLGTKEDLDSPARPVVIRLCDPDAAGDTLLGLAIAEGIENAIAAAVRYSWFPIWATATAGNMRAFPVINGVETLTIFADHDKINPQTGQRAGDDAALECGLRWQEADREARIIKPTIEGLDFADMQERAA